MRLPLFAVAVLFVLGVASALAGDSATFAPLGYSEDNRYFAYEEFSIGDEGRPPFATIGIVDRSTGTHIEGSPWTATGGEDGESTLSTLRLEVTTAASEALARTGIEDPAHFLALIGDGVRDDGQSLTFALPQGADPDALGPPMELSIMKFAGLIKDRCSEEYGGYSVGFALMLLTEDRAKAQRLGQQYTEDGTDDCVRRFRIYGVLQPYNGGDVTSLVAVVSVYTVGFEGYDRRFLVFPVGPSP